MSKCSRRGVNGNGYREVVQRRQRLRLYHARRGGRDLFVHFTGINGDGYRSLSEGAKVSYEEENGPKGPKAVDVTKI